MCAALIVARNGFIFPLTLTLILSLSHTHYLSLPQVPTREDHSHLSMTGMREKEVETEDTITYSRITIREVGEIILTCTLMTAVITPPPTIIMVNIVYNIVERSKCFSIYS